MNNTNYWLSKASYGDDNNIDEYWITKIDYDSNIIEYREQNVEHWSKMELDQANINYFLGGAGLSDSGIQRKQITKERANEIAKKWWQNK